MFKLSKSNGFFAIAFDKLRKSCVILCGILLYLQAKTINIHKYNK